MVNDIVGSTVVTVLYVFFLFCFFVFFFFFFFILLFFMRVETIYLHLSTVLPALAADNCYVVSYCLLFFGTYSAGMLSTPRDLLYWCFLAAATFGRIGQ